MKQGNENQAVGAGGIIPAEVSKGTGQTVGATATGQPSHNPPAVPVCTVCEDGYKATTNGICTNPACSFSATHTTKGGE